MPSARRRRPSRVGADGRPTRAVSGIVACYRRLDRMDPARLRELLNRVQGGHASVDDAVRELRQLPFVELGYATVDHHRALRQGVPEVILGEGKSPPQIAAIARELALGGQNVLVTRLDPEKAADVRVLFPELVYKAMARVGTFEQNPIPRLGRRPAALVSAGTSDLPVAEE